MTTSEEREKGLDRSPIAVGALAGLLAGIPTGIALQLGTEVLTILGSIVGMESLLVGWLFHLILSTVFGAFFGWHVEWPVFRTLTNTVGGSVLWGVIFGVVWYAYVVIGFIIPGIVDLFRFSGEGIPFPILPGPGGEALLSAVIFSVAYVIYGALLGWGYARLEDVRAEPDRRGPDSEAEPSDSKKPSESR